MKDRVSTEKLSNGAVRYEKFGSDGVSQGYIYLRPADEPSEVGTPLNKANLLSDLTALLMGCPSTDNLVPTQAFDKLNQFTFIVDSNEKLALWASADSTYNFTSVLVKKGTFTSSVGVNLTNAGTKVVVGESGSNLSFTNTNNGLYYSVLTSSTNFMFNVSVKVTYVGNVVRGFYNCTNLYNCYSEVTGGQGSSTTDHAYAFYNCAYLNNCIGFANNRANNTTSKSIAFCNCQYITDCIGKAENGNSDKYVVGFYLCHNITNAKANVSVSSGTAYGFEQCSRIILSEGTTSGSGTMYAFYSCSGMFYNKGKFDTTTCCANVSSYNSTYAVANTGNGGWNEYTSY